MTIYREVHRSAHTTAIISPEWFDYDQPHLLLETLTGDKGITMPNEDAL